MTSELPDLVCVVCGEDLQREAVNLEKGGKGLPLPGDIAMCGACGALLCATPDMGFRVATPEDMEVISPKQRGTLASILRRRGKA